jgi:hypothetical protein
MDARELKGLQELRIEEVIYSELKGASFEVVEKEIKNSLDVLLTVFNSPAAETPEPIRNELDREGKNFFNFCVQALGFNVNDPNYAQTRGRLVESFKGVWNSVGKYRGHALALRAIELDQLAKDARQTLGEVRETSSEVARAKDEALSAAKGAREAAQLSAISSLTAAYDREAKDFASKARIWAYFSIGALGISASVMYSFYVDSNGQNLVTIQSSLVRVAILAALYGLAHVCLRTHLAYRHLEAVNRHRVNIGRTFEAFKAAQPSEQAKNIMAALTAEHMLAFGKSGLLSKDLSVQSPISAANELVRSILNSKQATP